MDCWQKPLLRCSISAVSLQQNLSPKVILTTDIPVFVCKEEIKMSLNSFCNSVSQFTQTEKGGIISSLAAAYIWTIHPGVLAFLISLLDFMNIFFLIIFL